ncbi:MAG: UDP-N-acetylmuramate dehydrogenase [Bdellovibrionaceae bacterium]|nr:UDP-N-acetylmuramate dehydrogenase [Bdellovibrio sp.]
MNILRNVKLADYTSWMIGGEAEYFCLPTTVPELQEALRYAKANQLPITVFGGGSNILISDHGIKGLTICLRRFSEITTEVKEDKIYINCLAGTAKSELLKAFLKNQLAPALFMAGLPGDVGGGVVMNAGVAEAFEPREFMELVDAIEVMTLEGEVKRLEKSKLTIRYRHTDGWQPHIVIRALISWPLVKDPTILQQVRDANKLRLSKQPLDMPSCGSVFKNPDGHKAAQLIDQCGLKGFRIGDAQVSLKHANFIVNLNQATAADTLAVIEHVKKKVYEDKGVSLTTEVVKLGQFNL